MRFALGLATIALISAGPSISRGQPTEYFLGLGPGVRPSTKSWCHAALLTVLARLDGDSSRLLWSVRDARSHSA